MSVSYNEYACLECGTRQIFPVKNSAKVGKVNEAFCFKCERRTQHIHVGDIKTFLEFDNSGKNEEYRKVLKKKYDR